MLGCWLCKIPFGSACTCLMQCWPAPSRTAEWAGNLQYDVLHDVIVEPDATIMLRICTPSFAVWKGHGRLVDENLQLPFASSVQSSSPVAGVPCTAENAQVNLLGFWASGLLRSKTGQQCPLTRQDYRWQGTALQKLDRRCAGRQAVDIVKGTVPPGPNSDS